MADVKWSAFPSGTTISGSDIVVGLQTSSNVQWPFSDVVTYIASALTVTGSGSNFVKGTSPTLVTPVLNGTVTGTGVSQSSSASTLVQRDANKNIFCNNYFASATSTVSAGGTTILTAASSRFQALTGSSSQTYQLPDATTMSIGPAFVFNNNSSGSLIVTNAGGSTLYTVPAGGVVQGGPTSVSSSNGSWDFHPYAPGTVTWGSGTTGLVMNTALSTTPSVSGGASGSTSPAFIPQRGSSTTGYGGDSTHLYGIIGGTAAFTATATSFVSPGYIRGLSTVVGSLPSAATAGAGAMAFVSDATTTLQLGLGLAVTGGGANKVPVYSDGTQWLIG